MCAFEREKALRRFRVTPFWCHSSIARVFRGQGGGAPLLLYCCKIQLFAFSHTTSNRKVIFYCEPIYMVQNSELKDSKTYRLWLVCQLSNALESRWYAL